VMQFRPLSGVWSELRAPIKITAASKSSWILKSHQNLQIHDAVVLMGTLGARLRSRRPYPPP